MEKKKLEAQEQADLHIVSRPPDGKLFLISNIPQERLSRRYLIWVWVYLVIFFGALGGINWVWQYADF